MADYYRVEYEVYNHRRYSRPWTAQVSLDGLSLSMEFIPGAFSGDYTGGEGVLLIPLQPNTILAYGQKDNRGNKTKIVYLFCDSELAVQEITKSEARDYLLNQKSC
jgi:hypothetical protein